MHTTLQPGTNIKFLAVWGGCAIAVAFIASPAPWLLFGIGAVMGIGAGIVQAKVIREQAGLLITTRTAMDVRRIFSSSRGGRIYIFLHWSCMVALFALAFYLLQYRAIVGLGAAYSSFAFTRELVTLRETFALQRLCEKQRHEPAA